MDDKDPSVVTGSNVFRGSEYVVTMEVRESSVTIEVEDKTTADQWRGTFDATYIENLSHKTGNFKQFSIFISMIESAILKNSESVCLDLLTFADLESLRQRKSGSTALKSSVPQRPAVVNSKRYLILTYTVEFDRIHYPLPLPYAGKPDPRALQETIRSLREEITLLKKGYPDHKTTRENERLQKEVRRVTKEKEQIEEEYLQFRRELRTTASGNTVKDIRTLKTMVKNLEEELMKEKTRHQRSTSKRSQEYRDLLEEVEELRASERNLRVRVKNLTNELAVYKRGRVRMTDRPSRAPIRQRSSSFDRNTSGLSLRDRSLSRERSLSAERSLSQDRLNYSSGSRNRSLTRDRPHSAPNSRLSQQSPRFLNSLCSRSRSPSPAGARVPRFDPTAYVKDKERRKRETNATRTRQTRARLAKTSDRFKSSPNRSNSSNYSNLSRHRSRNSSREFSDDFASDSSAGGSRGPINLSGRSANLSGQSGRSATSYRSIPNTSKGRPTSRSKVTPEHSRTRPSRKINSYAESGDESDYFDRSAEISEIDERLSRLQQLMKASLS